MPFPFCFPHPQPHLRILVREEPVTHSWKWVFLCKSCHPLHQSRTPNYHPPTADSYCNRNPMQLYFWDQTPEKRSFSHQHPYVEFHVDWRRWYMWSHYLHSKQRTVLVNWKQGNEKAYCLTEAGDSKLGRHWLLLGAGGRLVPGHYRKSSNNADLLSIGSLGTNFS